MLLAETHLTSKYNFQVRGYTSNCSDHPDGKVHGGTEILVRNRIEQQQQIICKVHLYNYNQETMPTALYNNGREILELLQFTRRSLYIRRRSSLCLDFKVLLFNSTLKPKWTYGSQLWGTQQRSQSLGHHGIFGTKTSKGIFAYRRLIKKYQSKKRLTIRNLHCTRTGLEQKPSTLKRSTTPEIIIRAI